MSDGTLMVDAEFESRVRRNEPMSRHTSWHVGGPADLYFSPRDRADLLAFLGTLPEDTPLFWLGLGSNLLVRDGGIRGVVIDTQSGLTRLERINDTTLTCEAGVPCARLARQCIKWGMAPAEFLAGIPGTLGGALCHERRRLRRRDLAARAQRRCVRRARQRRAGATRANTSTATGTSCRRRRASSSSRPRWSSSTGRASPKRRCASCCCVARKRSPSANGAAVRRSPIRPAITPRGSSRPRASRARASATSWCRPNTPISWSMSRRRRPPTSSGWWR